MRIANVIHVPIVNAVNQWRVFTVMTHVNKHETPTLILNPLFLLGQLNELFSAKDSAEMPQETEKDRLLSRSLGQSTAVLQLVRRQRFFERQRHRAFVWPDHQLANSCQEDDTKRNPPNEIIR